jgi:hypothetical protein
VSLELQIISYKESDYTHDYTKATDTKRDETGKFRRDLVLGKALQVVRSTQKGNTDQDDTNENNQF